MPKKKNDKTQPEQMKFEQAMDELEKIVAKMEEGGLTLDESIEKFERGIRLSQICAKHLRKAELKVEKLTRTDDGELVAEPFEPEIGETSDDTADADEPEEETGPEEGLLF